MNFRSFLKWVEKRLFPDKKRIRDEAIRQSIIHWREVAKETWRARIDITSKSCALCKEYRNGRDCSACPVYKKTGQNMCVGTPYGACADHISSILWTHRMTKKERERWYRLAMEEVRFLEALLLED